MNRHLFTAIILTCLLVPFAVSAQNDDVQAAVGISIQNGQEAWVGQQVTVNLDLKTTGFSFSNSHFNLPEVNGGFLMQIDTTTIKLSERIDGQSWQIVRYPLAFYPQKAGKLKIPPIDIRFTTSAGFGSTNKAFEFQTRPLELSIEQPKGVKDGDLVVTTSSFELDHNWQPGPGSAQTGDAFTLTVNRRAKDISAMLLAPLPVFQTEGLAAYPQTPQVNDKSYRGDLTGERIDSIIWVAEKPGSYAIPAVRFQWWDPGNRELKQQIIPGRNLEVLPSSSDSVVAPTDEQTAERSRGNSLLMAIALAGILAALLWRRFSFSEPDRNRNNERAAFTKLQKACRNNQPGQIYNAIYAWLGCFSNLSSRSERPLTLDIFIEAVDDSKLTSALEQLQFALVTQDHTWQGGSLAGLLKSARSKIKKNTAVKSQTAITPLNPQQAGISMRGFRSALN